MMNEELDRAIDTVSGRWKGVRLLKAGLMLAAVLSAGLVLLFALDNLIHLGAAARTVLGSLLLGSLAYVGVRFLVIPWLRPLTREEAALLIERAFPEMDDRLINAERLARDERTPGLVLQIVRVEAAELVNRFDLRRALPLKTLKPLVVAAGIAVVLLGAYSIALPQYFANALKRYIRPGSFTAPITRTMLRVQPGNVTVLEGANVLVMADVSGEIPSSARLTVGDKSYDMRFLGGYFAFEFRNVEAPFEYSVQAGDAESDTYRVAVIDRTKIQAMRIEYVYPEYLRMPGRVEDPAGGHIAAVEGTRVTVTLRTTKPLKHLQVASPEPSPLTGNRWEFEIARSASYRFDWVDRDGLEGKSPTYTVTALKDNPPTVKLLEPSRNLTLRSEGGFTTVLQAADDFGLASVTLFASKGDKDRISISQFETKNKDIRASRRVEGKELQAKPGDTVGLFAVARDLKGTESTSNVVYVRLISEAQANEDILKELAGVIARLRQAIEWQKKVRERTTGARPDKEALAKEQYGILKALVEIVAGWVDPDTRHLAARGRLLDVIKGPATRAVEQVRSDLAAGAATQAVIVSELEAIVADLEGVIAAIQKGDLEKALSANAEKTPRQEAKDLLAGLKDFMEQQRKVIQESMDLKLRSPEDMTEDQKKKLETLKQTEEQWGKFFQEKANDLSKLPPQDFSNSSVLKELNEAFSELKKAAGELNKKAVEMAIPFEQSGLELAKSITENIERWLADAPDNLKWNMEEPTKDVEVPKADLPSELEDIIGDLIDKEDKLAEDSQDVTSSWMDSINKGAGWGVSDGPISNMSAKGITGNLQPNSNEVGGRSGEGRSGKSSGQMVEESASGKGGKQTPTRSTPDPYEAGRVKDTSKDPSGGSTGGGKISGANKEGLRGVPPQQIQQKMDRLADRQADVRNTAEKAKVAMQKRGYVSEDLAKAIEQMKQLEDQLRKKQGASYTAEAKAIAEKLEALRKTIQDQLDITRDPTKSVSKEKRSELLNALDEEIPAEFKDWVKEYYKALSEK